MQCQCTAVSRHTRMMMVMRRSKVGGGGDSAKTVRFWCTFLMITGKVVCSSRLVWCLYGAQIEEEKFSFFEVHQQQKTN